jgi:hypothetical protein
MGYQEHFLFLEHPFQPIFFCGSLTNFRFQQTGWWISYNDPLAQNLTLYADATHEFSNYLAVLHSNSVKVCSSVFLISYWVLLLIGSKRLNQDRLLNPACIRYFEPINIRLFN